MSKRFDIIKWMDELPETTQRGLIFQTHDLDREWLEFTVRDSNVTYEDYEFQLVDNTDENGLFSKKMEAVPLGTKRYNGDKDIRMYTFHNNEPFVYDVKIVFGKVKHVRRVK
jgi:hypothetical protein